MAVPLTASSRYQRVADAYEQEAAGLDGVGLCQLASRSRVGAGICRTHLNRDSSSNPGRLIAHRKAIEADKFEMAPPASIEVANPGR